MTQQLTAGARLRLAIREEQPHGKSLSFREGAKAKPVGLEPGKATLDMNVTFSYARKH